MNLKSQKFGQYLFFIAGSVAMMCMTLSSYGIATVTPRLLAGFGAMEYYTLTSLMSSVGMLIFLPIAGKLVDTVGRRPMLLLGGMITLIASVAAAFSPNFVFFLILRGLITVGSAFLTPIPSATLPFLFESKELPKLYGFQAAFLALGTFFGSAIAGWCSDIGLTWLAVAYPGILTAIAVVVMYMLCPAITPKIFPGMDFVGILLLCFIIIPLVFISSFAPQLGWTSLLVLIASCVMLIAFVLFVLHENRCLKPLVNLKLFSDPIFTGVLLCTFLLVWYQTAMRSYIPLAVQNVMGHSAAMSGMVSLPRSILNVLFPGFCGAWVAAKQSKRCWKGLFAAGLLIAIGNFLICLTASNASLLLIFVGLGLTGISESFKGAAQTPALQCTVPKEEMGAAMSLSGMFGSLGSTVSSAVFGAIHSSVSLNASNPESLFRANQIVFLGAALSGIAVCILAVFLVRKKI